MNRKIGISALTRAAMAAALVVGVGASASAQITFTATNTYKFASVTNANVASTMTNASGYASSASVNSGNLSVTADGFTVITVDDASSISTTPNSLGKVHLNNVTATYTVTTGSTSRYLFIKSVFSAPSGVASAQYFVGKVTGSVDGTGSSVFIDFQCNVCLNLNTGIPFTQSGTDVTLTAHPSWTDYENGNFRYSITDQNVSLADSYLNGRIVANPFEYIPPEPEPDPTPEPASMVLLATGLLGVIGAARRRNKK